jgi:hypothetical protein
MTPDLPTFRSVFSEFSDVSDPQITMLLTTLAPAWVDEDIWSAKDYPLGILYWSAHILQLTLTQQASQAAGGTGETDLFIRQIRFGERSIGFQQRQGQKEVEAMAGPGESLLSQTIYGQQFLQLRARNVPAIAVI